MEVATLVRNFRNQLPRRNFLHRLRRSLLARATARCCACRTSLHVDASAEGDRPDVRGEFERWHGARIIGRTLAAAPSATITNAYASSRGATVGNVPLDELFNLRRAR